MPAGLDDYEVLAEIGHGGQGVVYRARQKSLNRMVALKVIGVGSWATERQLRRFQREAEVAASLDHPAIVAVHEIGERAGQCYFSMKLIEGAPLDEFVRQNKLSSRRAAEMMARLARAVHYAHERGILHRDIKPGNILVDAEGNPHLTDFGMARITEGDVNITRTREMLGTPSYMAPEQTSEETEELTRATDVYGLGAVLYHLLTGRPPFLAANPYETIRLLREKEAVSPRLLNRALDEELATICLKCLEKNPARRYSTALELAEDLERWLHDQPILAKRAGVVRRSRKLLRRNRAIVLTLALSLGLLAAFGFSLWRGADPSPPAGLGIAVLPFENLSAKENAYFADGIHDDLITRLSKVSALRVISRTSVMSYRGKHDVREIGRALGVAHVLEGSVQRDAHRLHVNAQLIDARNDASVWAEEYDREVSDVFALQSEIAREVAAKLQAKIVPPQLAQIERQPTTNLEAYDALLQGNFFSEHRTAEDFRKALDYYEQAIRFDPNYALAYARLAVNAANLANNFLNPSTKEGQSVVGKARAAAKKALQLDPNLSDAHIAQGMVAQLFDFDFAVAEAQFRRALDLAPQNNSALEHLANALGLVGKFDEAVTMVQRAIALDPLRSGSIFNLSGYLTALGRYDEAEAAIRRVIALQPSAGQNYMQLTRILILRQQPAAAVEAAKRETDPFFRTYASALASFAHNDLTQADAELTKLIKEDSDDGGSQIASIYALRKEPDKMFQWLEHARATHDTGITEIRFDPFLAAYKNDPRFIAFARKIGL